VKFLESSVGQKIIIDVESRNNHNLNPHNPQPASSAPTTTISHRAQKKIRVLFFDTPRHIKPRSRNLSKSTGKMNDHKWPFQHLSTNKLNK